MVIVIRNSKTIQFSERVLEVPVARDYGPALYVVHWVECQFRQLPADKDQEAFRLSEWGRWIHGITDISRL